MVDKDLILAKAGSVKRHIDRVKAKSVADLAIFLQDLDRQESMAFNIQKARYGMKIFTTEFISLFMPLTFLLVPYTVSPEPFFYPVGL